jgi:hypothetical protein
MESLVESLVEALEERRMLRVRYHHPKADYPFKEMGQIQTQT